MFAPMLASALADAPDGDFAIDASRALPLMGRAGERALASLAASPKRAARTVAVGCISMIPDPSDAVLDLLAAALDDREPFVRDAAVRSAADQAGRCRDRLSDGAAAKTPQGRAARAVALFLGSPGDASASRGLAEVIRSGGREARLEACRLIHWGDRLDDAVIAALDGLAADGDPEEARAAERAFLEARVPAAAKVRHAVKALAVPCVALGAPAQESAKEMIEDAVLESADAVREIGEALPGLGSAGKARLLKALVPVAVFLRPIRPQLRACADDPSVSVRKAAAVVLRKRSSHDGTR